MGQWAQGRSPRAAIEQSGPSGPAPAPTAPSFNACHRSLSAGPRFLEGPMGTSPPASSSSALPTVMVSEDMMMMIRPEQGSSMNLSYRDSSPPPVLTRQHSAIVPGPALRQQSAVVPGPAFRAGVPSMQGPPSAPGTAPSLPARAMMGPPSGNQNNCGPGPGSPGATRMVSRSSTTPRRRAPDQVGQQAAAVAAAVADSGSSTVPLPHAPPQYTEPSRRRSAAAGFGRADG